MRAARGVAACLIRLEVDAHNLGLRSRRSQGALCEGVFITATVSGTLVKTPRVARFRDVVDTLTGHSSVRHIQVLRTTYGKAVRSRRRDGAS